VAPVLVVNALELQHKTIHPLLLVIVGTVRLAIAAVEAGVGTKVGTVDHILHRLGQSSIRDFLGEVPGVGVIVQGTVVGLEIGLCPGPVSALLEVGRLPDGGDRPRVAYRLV
jgi:hypothetical protein